VSSFGVINIDFVQYVISAVGFETMSLGKHVHQSQQCCDVLQGFKLLQSPYSTAIMLYANNNYISLLLLPLNLAD